MSADRGLSLAFALALAWLGYGVVHSSLASLAVKRWFEGHAAALFPAYRILQRRRRAAAGADRLLGSQPSRSVIVGMEDRHAGWRTRWRWARWLRCWFRRATTTAASSLVCGNGRRALTKRRTLTSRRARRACAFRRCIAMSVIRGTALRWC